MSHIASCTIITIWPKFIYIKVMSIWQIINNYWPLHVTGIPWKSNAFPISRNPKHFQAISRVTLIKHLLISSANPAFVSGPHRCCTCGSYLIPLKNTLHTKLHTTSMKTLTMSVKAFCHGCYTELTVFQVFLCHQRVPISPTNSDLQMNTIGLNWKDRRFFAPDITTIWAFGSHGLKCILGYSYLKGVGLLQQVALIESSDLSTH